MKQLETGLILYHGSYCAVEEPDLDRCAKFKDFGRGFYLTSSKIQAENFAKISAAKAKSRGLISENERFGFISSFSVTDAAGLNCFYFDTADVAWLHSIVAHRRSGAFVDLRNEMTAYDVVSGKIANDDTNATILAYMGNVFGPMGSEQADSMCISLLLPERLQDQFCFRSMAALSKLRFVKSERVILR